MIPLVGQVLQRPPVYSALKIQGRRAYELARAGCAVEPAARTVRIDQISVLGYAWPHLELEIICGSGTYIRSIARDVGEALACGGYVEALVRTRIGSFTLEESLEATALSAESIRRHLRPALDAVSGLPRVVLDARQLDAVTHGQRLDAHDLNALPIANGPVALIDSDGNLVALAEFVEERAWLQPRTVLV